MAQPFDLGGFIQGFLPRIEQEKSPIQEMRADDAADQRRHREIQRKWAAQAVKRSAKLPPGKRPGFGDLHSQDDARAQLIGVREVNPELPRVDPFTPMSRAPRLPDGYYYQRLHEPVTRQDPIHTLNPYAYTGGDVQWDWSQWPPVRVVLPRPIETPAAGRILSFDEGDNVADPPYRKKMVPKAAPRPLKRGVR